MGRSLRICVVGAGIMGMSSAYCLAKEYPGSNITIYSKEFTPNTTSNFAFGIIFCKEYNSKMYNHKIAEWSSETSQFCSEVTQKDPLLAQKMGIKPLEGFLILSKKWLREIETNPDIESIAQSPSLRATCTYFRNASAKEIEDKFLSKNVPFDILMDLPRKTTRGELNFYTYGTFIIDTDLYLLWLKRKLLEMEESGALHGVRFIGRNMKHLSDLVNENFDIIINCSGLGAGKLVDDKLVAPIRAQWILIREPEIENLYYAGRTCICPRPGRVALGSVFQWGRSDEEIDPLVTEDNWRRAKALFPEIRKSQILGEYVHFRPGREGGARLETEIMRYGNRSQFVIHNYGHAGTGIGQHWGCALNVVNLARSHLDVVRSKL